MTVRRAIDADVPFLQAMIWQALLASPIFLAHYGIETVRQAEEQYWNSWTEDSDPAFVALDATGYKLGAITLKPHERDEPISGWRIGIGVEARMRGQGVGQRLIEQAMTFARGNGASSINLLVDPTNTRAISLYQRIGFVQTGERDEMIEMQINLH